MPQPTARFPFEHRLAKWAQGVAIAVTGHRCALFVGFRPDGSVRRIYFMPPGQPLDGEKKTALADAYRSWFLYSPYAGEQGAYVEWLGLPADRIGTWTGSRPTAADLAPTHGDALAAWPDAWRVIVP